METKNLHEIIAFTTEENLPSLQPSAEEPLLLENYIQAATSANTRKAYQTDVRHFIQWGGRLPTSAEAILQYLRHYAASLNSRTLSRRLTALKNWHLYQGFADPTSHPAIHKTLTGIRNIHGKPKKKAPPLTLAIITMMSAALSKSTRLIDYRNRALLLLGFFGAFRRSELVSLEWKNINYVTEGMEVLIPRSKTDQSGEGQICAIPKSQHTLLCPIAALTAWQERCDTHSDAIFRQITAGGNLLQPAIKAHQVNIIIKSIAMFCQLKEADTFSSHSLRRGFATEASKTGAPFGSIMRHGRWRHEGTVLGYIDEGKRFDQNAAASILNHYQTEEKK
ncbi:MAG: tyrosine-type recombinase/integrase [Gammaproteobacteria bacterium]|nr:tyrosine-type recombinase/integrase [Gammaproteobacteria bacterium]